LIKRIFLLVLISLLSPVDSVADSLFDNAKTPFYGVNRRLISVGDIITIYVSESTSAAQQASTSTERESRLGGSLQTNWEQIGNLLGNETLNQKREYGLNGDDKYEGSGQTSRRSQVKAVVSSVVTEILDNGNLFIEGIHKVKVNDELETIRVAGIIRPQDISPQNSVYSYQVAKAEISVHGTGVVAAKQSPGIMTKMFNWLF
jgi:flagellar L-ring protein precursor FlgH